MKKHISVPKPDSQESGYMSDVLQLLHGGREGLQEGAYSQNILAPYLYNLAGVTPEYESEGDRTGRMSEVQAKHDKALSYLTDMRQARNPKDRRAVKAQIAASLGDEAAADFTKKNGKIKGQKLKKYLRRSANGAQGEMSDIANAPLRVKGFTENADSKAQREREGAILQQEQEMLQKSLSMNNDDVLAADPALKRQLEEEQAQLQQQQVGQFGSLADAGLGTTGAVQNAAMAQRRAEAISDSRRQNIGLYSGLQTQQTQLNTQQAAAKQALAGAPSAAQQQSAMNFGQLGQGYGTLLQSKAGQRAQQFQANSFNQTQPGLGESILKGIGGLLQPFKQNG